MLDKNGQLIADELGTTRQYVSNTIKRALNKLFLSYKQQFPELTDFEICAKLMDEFSIDITPKNFQCFPKRIREKVKASAADYAEEHNYQLVWD